MNRRRMVLALVAVLVLASLSWLVSLSKTSQGAPAPSGEASFKGKVLLVQTSDLVPLFLLEKAQVQKIGDRLWLMGRGVDDGKMGSWYKGRTVRLYMDHIVSITEFDDLKEAKKASEAARISIGVDSGGAVEGALLPVPGPVDQPKR